MQQRSDTIGEKPCAKHRTVRPRPLGHASLFLRAPLASDYDALACWISDSESCARWAGPQLGFPFPASELAKLLTSDGVSSFSLVNSTDEFLGFGQLVETSPSILRLARIVVAPHLRRLGLGKTLCQLLLAKAANHPSAALLALSVYRDNPAAISLYSSLGFVETPPHPRPDVLSMQRSLPRA